MRCVHSKRRKRGMRGSLADQSSGISSHPPVPVPVPVPLLMCPHPCLCRWCLCWRFKQRRPSTSNGGTVRTSGQLRNGQGPHAGSTGGTAHGAAANPRVRGTAQRCSGKAGATRSTQSFAIWFSMQSRPPRRTHRNVLAVGDRQGRQQCMHNKWFSRRVWVNWQNPDAPLVPHGPASKRATWTRGL